jgi:hypothetical protein
MRCLRLRKWGSGKGAGGSDDEYSDGDTGMAGGGWWRRISMSARRAVVQMGAGFDGGRPGRPVRGGGGMRSVDARYWAGQDVMRDTILQN